MAFNQGPDKRKILDQVLLHLPAISAAPKSILDFPEARGLYGPALDRFEDEQKAIDAAKIYKAVDDKGNIYEVKNPWSTRDYIAGRGAVVQAPPKMVMTYGEACNAAKSGKVADIVTEEKERW